MPDFSRKPIFLLFSRIPFVASGLWCCLFLLVFLPAANGAVHTADIPIVTIPQNSGELHSLVNALNATSAPKKTPFRDMLAAVAESEYGQIQPATGNSPQNSNLARLKTETVNPSGVSFRDQPAQIASQPLGSAPFQGTVQSTRPILPNTTQKPKPLPSRIEPVRYGREFTGLDFSEDETFEELHFASAAETHPLENTEENERLLPSDLFSGIMGLEEAMEEMEEPTGFSRRDLFLETQPEGEDEIAGDSDLLNRAIPERKEKSEGKLTFSPVGAQLIPVLSVLGSLCLVLGAFFLFVLFLKKVGPKNGGNLPREALENVGRYPLNQKLQLNLLRLGNRLILVAVTPDGGIETVSEIESPDEVAQILAQCRKLDPNGSQAQFKSVLDEFAQEKSSSGFFGPNDPKRKTNTTPTLSSLLAGGLQEANLRKGGVYG